MMDYTGEGAPWWMAGSLFAAWVVREAWGALRERRTKRTETDANVELIDSMRNNLVRVDERIRAMEEAHQNLSARLEAEIKSRMTAEEEAHKLRLRVMVLESAMRQVGAVIPPEVHYP